LTIVAMLNAKPVHILEIVEVQGPSLQGLSQPYKCIANDGNLYYVKGQQTDRASLWREWISAHLARVLNLPLPPFSLVQVSEALLAELPNEWRHIGAAPAFGSQHHDSTSWFEASLSKKVPPATQQAVLVFDWWIKNSDRVVGNTNLLWDANSEKLVVIDHNQAFDPDFDAQAFCQDHVFANQWGAVNTDFLIQNDWSSRLNAALPQAQWACDNAPSEWRWANAEMDVPANFVPDEALAVLARCATPELWRTV
jgi:hypothetical protein